MNEKQTGSPDDQTMPPRQLAAGSPATVIGQFLRSPHRAARSPEEVSRDLLLSAPSFAQLDARRALAFIKQRGCHVVAELPRDQLIDEPDKIIFILAGLVSLARFDHSAPTKAALQRARRNHADDSPETKFAKPLASIANLNICQFAAGSVVDLRVIKSAALQILQNHYQFLLFSNTPASYVIFTVECLTEVETILPPAAQAALLAARVSSQARISENAVAGETPVDQFFMRNGLSVASTIRVLDLNKCVWCKKCEDACTERYGTSRIDLNIIKKEVALVTDHLGLVGTCRTCTDQRCVDACGYSAIRFDENRQEVVILEDKCEGCTACANACPYHAIEMKELAPSSYFNIKLQARLGTKKPPPRTHIASKCDHCADHGGQQACIAACPEGALLELAPHSLLGRLGQSSPASASPMGAVAIAPPLRTAPTVGAAPTTETPAVTKIARWYWPAGGLIWLASIAEISARQVGHRSLFGFSEPGKLVRAASTYYAGNPLSRKFGILATTLLAFAMFYPLLQRVLKKKFSERPLAALRQISNSGFHTFVAVMGAATILSHSNGKIFLVNGYNSYSLIAIVSFWLMVILLLTGWLSSQISSLVLRKRAACAEKVRQFEQQLDASAARCVPNFTADLIAAAAKVVTDFTAGRGRPPRAGTLGLVSSLRALRYLIFAPALPMAEFISYLIRIPEHDLHIRTKALLADLCRYRLRVELLGHLSPLIQIVKRMHLPLAVVFFGMAVLHIIRPN